MADEAMAIPEWALVLPFDTDERAFVRGFQLGAIWGRVDRSGKVLVYADTAEMLVRILERYPDVFTVEDNGDEWIAVTFTAYREWTDG